jgi:hypothetical protein
MRAYRWASLAMGFPLAVAAACSGDDAGGAAWTIVDSGADASSSGGSSGVTGSSSGAGSSTSSTGSSSGASSGSSSSSGTDGGVAIAEGGGGFDAEDEAEAESGPPCDTDPGMALQFEGQTPDLVQATIAKLPTGRASRTIELWAWFDGSSRSTRRPGGPVRLWRCSTLMAIAIASTISSIFRRIPSRPIR